jgi:hypothetical protein
MPKGNKSRDKTQIQHNTDGSIILRAAVHYQNGAIRRHNNSQTSNKKGADFSSFFQFPLVVLTAVFTQKLPKLPLYFFAVKYANNP